MSVFFQETAHKARRDYTCEGCGNPIPAGSFYMAWRGVFEGDFFSSKLCSDCLGHLAHCEACQENLHDGWCPGDIGEWRSECVGDWVKWS